MLSKKGSSPFSAMGIGKDSLRIWQLQGNWKISELDESKDLDLKTFRI